ncbi:MAG: tRNA (adenosine(37)-N6)-threonylcarbamoyltransferase complex transferase subunit TsaD [Nitrospira sp.]|nr:tRNA (adenosine(37)-N6)-threonylcarbamoyltransferase complex transferase subunit TsaD [Nitrospira sp.]
MLILAVDTSCDDTSASVVRDGRAILSNVVSSQNAIHLKYGGIVPELASRQHIEKILPVVDAALAAAGVKLPDINAIAFTYGPGLIGSLIIGACFAKSISFTQNIPLIAVNHLEGHINSVFLEHAPDYPFLSLVVSGGHTSIYLVNAPDEYEELARTRDDAAGEAYDKVAKMLGLGYPGGPAIDRLAAQGNPKFIAFPRSNMKGSDDFSFSGLKTSVLYYIKNHGDSQKADIAASFQAAVIDVLIKRTIDIALQRDVKTITIAGGVAANSELRRMFTSAASNSAIELLLPSPVLCTDNAAMIAAAAYHSYLKGDFADFSVNPRSNLPVGR